MTRLAVVEDNPDNRLLVSAILEDEFEIEEHERGDEALAAMTEDPPDIVLMDISLPGMDGVQVLHAMRRRPELAHLPVIALTAHAMSGDRERFLAEGFNDYVTKPILDEDLLVGAITGLLERQGLRSA
ncbi:MAG: response regulator [Acidobacteria bacterium]|nr:response regulator [Acidobacteriota bacterium]